MGAGRTGREVGGEPDRWKDGWANKGDVVVRVEALLITRRRIPGNPEEKAQLHHFLPSILVLIYSLPPSTSALTRGRHHTKATFTLRYI